MKRGHRAIRLTSEDKIVNGLAILIAGIYYLIKDKNDAQSRKVYSVFIVIGAVIIIALVVKIIVVGF